MSNDIVDENGEATASENKVSNEGIESNVENQSATAKPGGFAKNLLNRYIESKNEEIRHMSMDEISGRITKIQKPEPQNNEPPPVEKTLLGESPIGKAVHDFGRTLKNTAIWLFIFDLITAVLMYWQNRNIVFDGRYNYDRFGGDFYTTVSRGLSEITAYLDSIFKAQVILSRFLYFMSEIVINVTVLAITIGRGIMNIGTAIATERNQKIVKEDEKS